MNSAILSRPACNALRGLAIIGIFLHNYCHWLGPIVYTCSRSSAITVCPYSSF